MEKRKVNESQIKKLLESLKNISGISYDEDKIMDIYQRKLKPVIEEFGYNNLNRLLLDVSTKRNKKLIDTLINQLTVNETYFFRESYQFEALINYAIPEIIKTQTKVDTIRILSAPCSTGEEVYSIVIYLLEEGSFIKRYDFMILGVDIDSSAIEKAKKGIYSPRSVHKLNKELLEKYFKRLENGYYEVKKQLKLAANFKIVNILDKNEMEKLGKFDVIFSRNMLIYFDEKTKRKAIDIFHSVLKEKGFLFLGHAEKIENDPRFKTIKFENTFFYQKIE